MGISNKDVRVEQSRRISIIGCIGIVLLLALLVMLGAVSVRAGLNSQENVALSALGRMDEQVNKAPGILSRMIAMGCFIEPGEFMDVVEGKINVELAAGDYEGNNNAWDLVEGSWTEILSGCGEVRNEPSFIDLTTEMEGIRNRRSVEYGKYREAAEEYNLALGEFPASLVAGGFEPLQTGR